MTGFGTTARTSSHPTTVSMGAFDGTLSLSEGGIYTDNGATLAARTVHGVEVEADNYDAWVAAGQAYAYVLGSIVQLTDDDTHSYIAANVNGGRISIIRDDNVRISTPTAGSFPELAAGTDTIEYSDLYGQSVAAGNASGSVLSNSPFSNRYLMYAAGQRAFGQALGHSQERTRPQQFVYDAIHDFAFGYEQSVDNAAETSNSGFAHGVLSRPDLPSSVSLLTTCSAVGSANQEMLWKAATELTDVKNTIGEPWRNLETKFQRAALFWRLQGKHFVAGPLRHNQGEGNINRSKANHLAGLAQFRDDWQALAKSMNSLRSTGGFVGKAPFIVTQTCSGARYGFIASEVPWAQLQINVDDPTSALCCGPTYDQVYAADGVHLLALGQEMQGARQAVAYNAWLRGEYWHPLAVRKDAGFEPVRVGSTVTLRLYNHFSLPLIFDTTTITGLGANQGFTWHDNGDGNTVSVTNAVITNNTTITLTLSDVPTGTGGSIDIAMNAASGADSGPSSGNRSTLRTNGSGITTRSGRAVEHFICIDRVTL
ncbi:hypothetical protein [Ciceribacter sp. RN22]|uniref:hypothetical protein n=1 Tax=Ciceribacter sp. RN22 TaxID=2954932 RepID=UPI00209371CE|nr:hypothetical protein [Ciceribacter sp. RN22]MCO6180262.1 hypothetical protein [Ciceribacter sp. RN22]